MPPPSGIKLAEEIKRKHYPTKVVVLSMHDNELCVAEALSVGASAYVLKECGVEDIVKAVREALAGRQFVSHPFSLPKA
jgi:DNA-binding NarL/FixJ family response regulator